MPDDDYGDEWIPDPCEDDMDEPIGSCENCGVNLYPEDDRELCDQCLWWTEQMWLDREDKKCQD